MLYFSIGHTFQLLKDVSTMSFDGIFTYGILQELSETLVSGRISKIYQPFPNELILQVRAKGENRKLFNLSSP